MNLFSLSFSNLYLIIFVIICEYQELFSLQFIAMYLQRMSYYRTWHTTDVSTHSTHTAFKCTRVHNIVSFNFFFLFFFWLSSTRTNFYSYDARTTIHNHNHPSFEHFSYLFHLSRIYMYIVHNMKHTFATLVNLDRTHTFFFSSIFFLFVCFVCSSLLQRVKEKYFPDAEAV